MKKWVLMGACMLFLSCIQAAPDGSSESQQQTDQRVYQLFPTQNMWTFIKLNTRNGQMWQVQYDINGNDRFETFINILPLAPLKDETNGRFTLHATQNIYNFILIDQIDGRMWQVQWSTKSENRGIIPIQ